MRSCHEPACSRRLAPAGAGIARSAAGRRALAALAGVLAASALWGCGARSSEEGTPAKAPLDVVVVAIDTLRPDHLGFLGYPRDTAPYLARLAGSSLVFRRAFSTSTWTAPATASLFTSLYPPEHGVLDGFFVRLKRVGRAGGAAGTMSLRRLPEEIPTLPERFRARGYTTFGVTANVNIGPEMGFDRGFDRFARLHQLARGTSASAEGIATALEEWEPALLSSRPCFVYLHFNDPHLPYDSGEAWPTDPRGSEVERLAAAYDGEIRHLDRVLERVLGRFGWDRDAILVVVSDHGEEFREHGGLGHGSTLYGELLRVLFLMRVPGAAPAALDVNVSLIDVLPTLAELAGLEQDARWRGRSLAPLIREPSRGGAELAARPLYARRGRGAKEKVALILGDWKLIRRRAKSELYDVADDPLDGRSLAAERPEVVTRLSRELGALEAGLAAKSAEETAVFLDQPEIDSLRALGYVH